MKTSSFVSALVISTVLVGCDQGGEQASTEGDAEKSLTEQVVDTTKETATAAVEKTKEVTAAVVETGKEAAAVVSEKAGDVTDAVVEQAKGLIEKIKQYIAENNFDLAGKTMEQLVALKSKLPESLQEQITGLETLLAGKKAVPEVPATPELPATPAVPSVPGL